MCVHCFQICAHPTLELWSPSIEKIFPRHKPLVCSSETNWISVHQGRFTISPNALTTHGDIQCMCTPILRGIDDDDTYFGPTIAFKCGDLITSDAFKIQCNASDGSLYENTHSSVMLKPEVKSRQRQHRSWASEIGLNIIIFGFDTLSHLTWLRTLPKTHAYFTQELGGLVFEEYNIVGYNTRNAQLAMLTGRKFSELPEVTRGFPGAQYVDKFPWLFRELRDAGYVTQWGEDDYHNAAFTKVPRGFQNQPVDHYLRPFFMKIPPASVNNMKTFCLGSQPRHRVMMQNIIDLYSMYDDQPKFSFMFTGEYSHDNFNVASLVDDDLSSFLQLMYQRNWLNNTLFIFMSDHGTRYGKLRSTAQGRYEQRLPYLGIRFPEWFQRKYPQASENLQKNTARLTTLFDVHTTLKEILNHTQPTFQYSKTRGLNLLHEIPITRTCADAGIDPEWCSCIDWQKIPTNQYMVRKAVSEFISALNSYTNLFRRQCHMLELDEVVEAHMFPIDLRPSQKSHSESQHYHPVVVLYQIEIKVHPSGGLYGTVAKLDTESGTFVINRDEVNRNDRYGNQSACIAQSHPDLREFCYCISWCIASNLKKNRGYASITTNTPVMVYICSGVSLFHGRCHPKRSSDTHQTPAIWSVDCENWLKDGPPQRR